MNPTVSIDLVTLDTESNEVVLYLVEDGPWPDDAGEWTEVLKEIECRVLDAADIAIDGGVAKHYAATQGHPVRIQIESSSELPERVRSMAADLDHYVHQSDNEYGPAIESSDSISGLRIVAAQAPA